jgi:S1-C subfamily serine protease
MQESGSADSEMHGRSSTDGEERDDTTESLATLVGTGGATESGDGDEASESRPVARRPESRRGVRFAACVAAGALALGAGFGIAKVVDPPRAVPPSSAIPSPAKAGGVFVEDDDGTAQDSQTNILQSTGPGLVHVIADGTAVGIGMVLTPSGKVLTTYQPSRGAGNLTAKYVLSGMTFKAEVIGTDEAAGLALLQLEGGNGRAFSTLVVGNSATLVADTYKSKQLSFHYAGEVFDTAVGTSGTQGALAINTGTLVALNKAAVVGRKIRTGLMLSILQSQPAAEIGGPLVDLNGQVIGIMMAGAGNGLDISGYAMPINQALAIAAQIDAKARPSS